MEIFTGMCSFHFQDFFSEDRSETKGLKLEQLANGTQIFHSEIPFRNFGLPLKKSRFPEKISVRRDKIHLPFKCHPKIPDFGGVNGEQPYFAIA